ncbi:MAG: hypothetical protein J6P61_02445 [Erysipelotrichaceae bacterium]|nr:hypothetical protein [Erysipelotrichaceae bacterium]
MYRNPNPANILVIDVGTSSMRGILYNEFGERLMSHQIRYHPLHLSDIEVEQDIDDFKRTLTTIVQMIGEKYKIYAIALTSQRSSIVPVDRDGYPLMNTIMWQDRRNSQICEELAQFNDIIKAKTGAKVNSVFSGSKMTWIKRHCPHIAAKTYKYVNIPEYLIHYMTDQYVTDVTYASRSHLMNLKTRQWDDELLDIFGIKEEELCKIQEVGSICGYLLDEVAKEFGIDGGIPIITSGGDQQCAAVGNGACHEGVLSLVEGTGAFLITQTDTLPETIADNVICNCASVPGKYTLETNVLTCGSAYDWCRHTFYGDQAEDYQLINQELRYEYIQNTSKARVLPYFQGRSTPKWNPKATATFTNMSLSTTRAELLRAVLEGIFIELNANIKQLQKYVDIQEAFISGGLTKSSIINQMQSDIFNLPLTLSSDAESTARGALVVALAGLGICPDVEFAYQEICGQDTIMIYQPEASKHQQYQQIIEELEELYKKLYE